MKLKLKVKITTEEKKKNNNTFVRRCCGSRSCCGARWSDWPRRNSCWFLHDSKASNTKMKAVISCRKSFLYSVLQFDKLVLSRGYRFDTNKTYEQNKCKHFSFLRYKDTAVK